MTRERRTHEGHTLPRPAEDVVDQGLGFDIGTLLSRRRILGILGAATAGLAACSSGSTHSTSTFTPTSQGTAPGEIPDETAGPYPGDGSNGPDVLEQSGIVRGDIRSSFGEGSATAEGVPMTLELVISDLANDGAPYEGVAVYVWHCDRAGEYSMYAEGLENENYLRGVQVADEDGKMRFTSIFPGCYTGRWPHIHFEAYPDQAGVTDVSNVIATSQVALPKDVCDTVYAQPGYEDSARNLSQTSLDSDNVFGDDGGESQLATVTGDVTGGYTVALDISIDTTTLPGGDGDAPDGRPPGDPPGGGPTG